MWSVMKQYLILFVILFVVSVTRGNDNYLTCGQRKVKSVYLIHNGIDAEAGHWPWHAAIHHRNGEKFEYACGGSIIDERTILTASHCVYTSNGTLPATNVTVHVGRIQLSRASDFTQIHSAEKIIVHPGYSTKSIIHDIAVIKLSSNITMSKYVQPICLWTRDTKQDTIIGNNGSIVGFGLTEQGSVSERLKEASIYVVDTWTCIKSDRRVFGTFLTTEMFCGKGYMGAGACNGDSGGGIFFKAGSRWYVRGLVSFTPLSAITKQCDPLKYTAYTDVTKYLDWIKQYIDQRVLAYDTYDIDYEEKLRLFNFQNCGGKSLTSNNQDKIRRLPWLGFLVKLNEKDSRCTVTLITEVYAVGPAHCLEYDGVESFVILGSSSEDPQSECNGSKFCTHSPQTHQVQNVIVHPEFDKENYANNIALIELLTPADTTQQNVKAICMPVTPELRTNARTNLSMVTFSRSENLNTNIPVHYVESVECMKQYSQEKVMLNLQNSTFCAELANRKDATFCHALPAGSPLQETKIIYGSERYFLRGFEMLERTCNIQLPPIYINVEDYMDWILYNMRYNEQEAADAVKIPTVNRTLEAEWSELLQHPGKQKLALFNMDTCGIPFTPNQIDNDDDVPWIGFLKTEKNVNDSVTTEREIVVLISEWYALAANRMVRSDVVWRSIILGQQLPKGCFNCIINPFEMDIKKIIIPPPEHPSQTFALIELSESSWLKVPYIRPICLPFMVQLLQRKPTHVIMSSTIYSNQIIHSKKLGVIDRLNCQQRLLLEGHFVTVEANTTCAIEVERLRLSALSSRLGSPYQMSVRFGGRTRFFLHGMDANGPHSSNMSYGPYLFNKLELADLEWIVENMQDREHQAPFPNFIPIPNSKKDLFNLDTCGQSSFDYESPWMGKAGQCNITLISNSYAVGSASCLHHTQPIVTEFGDTCTWPETCKPIIQKNRIQQIFVHPQYQETSHTNDIALLQLTTSVDTSLPGVTPVCLPFIDLFPDYDTLSKEVFSDNIVTRIGDDFVDPVECQKRWQGLQVFFTIDESNFCALKKRTPDGSCKFLAYGIPLLSKLQINLSTKQVIRGFVVREPRSCSTFYPNIYTSTDFHLGWILEKMEQPGSAQVDLTERLIFNKK